MKNTHHHGDLKASAIKKTVELIQKRKEVAFTLREIALSLKVSHTAVYRHFKSKQDLLSYIAEEGFHKLDAHIISEAAKGKTVRQKFRLIGKAYIEFAVTNVGHYRSMFHHELRCGSEQREEFNTASTNSFSTLYNLIENGIKTQAFKKGDTTALSYFAWSSLHGFATLLIDGQFEGFDSNKIIQEAIEQQLEFIERALLK